MEAIRKRLIHMHLCRGITRRTIHRFFQKDSTLESIYRLSPTKLSKQFFISLRNAKLFYIDLHSPSTQEQTKTNVNKYAVVTIIDRNYPDILKRIKDPPLVLYAQGDQSLLLDSPALSVIGTRNASNEAMRKMELIVQPIIENNWIIVSGMALGIDRYAHELSLKYNGKTIAVLGGGFHHIYPRQNIQVFHEIMKHGLVISEYPPDMPPARYHFPERNRIISGLSFGTLVIEATERSGTLITVDQALDQGREVYAVPGSPLLPQTKGCHQMIQDGAKLVFKAEDILEDWDHIGENLFYS